MILFSLPIGTPSNYKNLAYTSMSQVSEMTRYGMRGFVLEYPNPVEKRAYFTEQADFPTNG